MKCLHIMRYDLHLHTSVKIISIRKGEYVRVKETGLICPEDQLRMDSLTPGAISELTTRQFYYNTSTCILTKAISVF